MEYVWGRVRAVWIHSHNMDTRWVVTLKCSLKGHYITFKRSNFKQTYQHLLSGRKKKRKKRNTCMTSSAFRLCDSSTYKMFTPWVQQYDGKTNNLCSGWARGRKTTKELEQCVSTYHLFSNFLQTDTFVKYDKKWITRKFLKTQLPGVLLMYLFCY